MGLELYYTAFLELCNCRAIGMGGEGPIPWTAINQWANEYQLSEEQRDDLSFYILKLDRIYLEHQAKKVKSELGKKSSKGKK
jgi:hypothetical protein